VLDADADLAAGLTRAQLDALRPSTVARVIAAEPQEAWRPPTAPLRDGALGLLVLDGLLARDVRLAGVGCTELLGTGDLLRPWTQEEHSVPVAVAWTVLERARVAILDERFAHAVQHVPVITARLLDRTIRRSQSQSIHLAITCLRGVDVRLHVLFWHLADRWGKVTPEGVVMDLPLTHQALGRIIGSRRPAVTTALGQLAERGVLLRTDHSRWLLRGEPPTEVERFAEPRPGDPGPGHPTTRRPGDPSSTSDGP
jgi:CRP/FNR family cyclic AMP-dependent transcriptional regulator